MENKSEEQALSIYLVAMLWTNRANEVTHGKCWGCGSYMFHVPKCPSLFQYPDRLVMKAVA